MKSPSLTDHVALLHRCDPALADQLFEPHALAMRDVFCSSQQALEQSGT